MLAVPGCVSSPRSSQASPHVAGLAALVRQAFPTYTPQNAADYLKYFALPRGGVPNNVWGYGLAFLPSIGCVNTLSPPSANVGAAGGQGTIQVTANPGCFWTAQSQSAFLTVTGGGSIYGNGTVSYAVAPNPGVARVGTLAIAGQVFTVTQAGAAPSVPPTLAPLQGGVIVVGGTNTLTGSGFTPGTRVKLHVATGTGPVTFGPYVPTGWIATSLTWAVPPTVPLGLGFGSVRVVNTDTGYQESNVVSAWLEGDPNDNLPTIHSLNGKGLGVANAGVGVAHIDTVVAKGSIVTIKGGGFNSPGVNLFTAKGNMGPLWPVAGGSATQIQVVVPMSTPTGPGNFQVVNNPYTGNVQSNAVSAVIGARPTITNVSVVGTTVTVTGTGFCSLSVINLFNLQGATVVNLGGLNGTTAKIPLTVVSDTQFTFSVPPGAVAGPAFVEVLNPPYIPFASSGNDPDGAFTIP